MIETSYLLNPIFTGSPIASHDATPVKSISLSARHRLGSFHQIDAQDMLESSGVTLPEDVFLRIVEFLDVQTIVLLSMVR